MDLLLTDRLACPRCGPEFGLILIADDLVDRRVGAGGLGCANCRDRYPVRDGVADLRPVPRGPLTEKPHAEAGARPVEIGALLGVLRGPGHLVVLGRLSVEAGALAGLIEGIEVVAMTPWAPTPPTDRVSPVAVRDRLPMQTRSARGVAMSAADPFDLEEAARLVASGGRIAVFDAPEGTEDALKALRLEIVASDSGRVVARR